MFTGLVEDVGTVARADRRSDALVIGVRPTTMPLGELVIGESICHDGTCLTVTEVGRDSFTVLAGAETLTRTT
ncbi:MAG: riboflavin synthase, partial [Deltaproteobacteria bacterium]|nr:riboflavin synthase [Deltaproteobacteria bacterium]